MVSEEHQQLFSAEASHVREAPTVSADRCKVRCVLPLVGVMAAVFAVGGWTLGSLDHATASSTTAFRRENQAHEVSTIALRQTYRGQTTAYGYKDVGKGGCLTPSGDAIAGKEYGVREHRAQDICDKDPTCMGYVASTGCIGAFLYSNPDGTVKGGGDPPKDSHSWKRAPCMAKDLDMSYVRLGFGKCVTADGEEPENDFDENVQDNGVACRERCSSDPSCKGFSAATRNFKGCWLWKEGNLKAGSRKDWESQAYCYVKESAGIPEDAAPAPAPETTKPPPTTQPKPSKPAPTGTDVEYEDLGSGKCKNADGTQLKHKWYADIDEKSLKDKCNKDENCYGYSKSKFGSGLLWMEGNLLGKGASWGGCKCMAKK